MSTHNSYFQNKICTLELSQIKILISAVIEKILESQEQVRNSRGKRAIGVRAIEVPVCIYM